MTFLMIEEKHFLSETLARIFLVSQKPMTKLSMDRIIQPPLLRNNQLQLIFQGKLSETFTKQVKRL